MSGLNRKGWQTVWTVREPSTLEESFYKAKRVSLKKYSLLAMGMGLLGTEVAKFQF